MTKTSGQFDYTRLSVAERILLAEEIWDSIAAEGRPIVLTQEQEQTLNQRLEDDKASPEAFPAWDDVRKRFRKFGDNRNRIRWFINMYDRSLFGDSPIPFFTVSRLRKVSSLRKLLFTPFFTRAVILSRGKSESE